MIVPAKETEDGITADVPDELKPYHTGESQKLPDGTYRITLDPSFVPPREAARRRAESEAVRISLAPRLKGEELTEAEIEAIAAAFDPWEPGEDYAVDDVVEYEGRLWECRQAHVSQEGWEPPAVLALWQRFRGNDAPDETPEWEASTPYAVGDQVTYEGTTYTCLQAHTSQVGWEPPNVAALWSAED